MTECRSEFSNLCSFVDWQGEWGGEEMVSEMLAKSIRKGKEPYQHSGLFFS